MPNPFENPGYKYVVLVNDEGQHSLWPAFLEKPAGWEVAHDSDTREKCLEYIEAVWDDMRPRSLIDKMSRLRERQ